MTSTTIIPSYTEPAKVFKMIIPLNGRSTMSVFISAVQTGTLYTVASPVPFTIADCKETRLSNFNGLVHRAQFVSEDACVAIEQATR